MKIIFGENEVIKEVQNNSNYLYKSDDNKLVCYSDSEPFINERIGQNNRLIIIGEIFSISNSLNIKHLTNEEKGKVLVKEFQKMGLINFQNQVEGRFLALNVSNNSATIFGDKLNAIDLYYSDQSNCFIASTIIEPIAKRFSKTLKYNQTSLTSMFSSYGSFAPKKHTIYKDINRLGVGERLEFNNDKVAVLKQPFKPKDIEKYNENHLKNYSDILHSSVDIRSSNTTNWVFLSSGWDSSSILAILSKLKGPSKVRAVILRGKYSKDVGVNNQFEVDRAKEIASYFQIPIDILDLDYTSNSYLSYWDEIRDSLKSNHLYVLNNFNYMKLAKHVKQNGSENDSVFNGEISDGAHNLGFSQFATVLDHPDLNFREYSDKMASYLYGPRFFESLLDGTYSKDFVFNSLLQRQGNVIFEKIDHKNKNDLIIKYLESFFISPVRFPFYSIKNSKIFNSFAVDNLRELIYEDHLKSLLPNIKPENIYSCMLYLYNSFHWQGGTVKGFTHASDHYGLNVSMPFWDNRLQSFLGSMPESWGRGLDFKPTKYPLKWTLNNTVDYPTHLQVGPHSYLYDIDPNWSADSDILYGSAGKSYFKEIIKDYKYEDIMNESHFNLNYLKKLVDEYCNDIQVIGQERTDLKNLISFCMVGWY